ncbi:MAG: hypothetical protein A3C47_04325 [Omnitrophica bacterium RIFCSPHIGHO2_02_FULL_51_18]|nr:MAG: hypothetical protein A3C47_04325 [Omnitrophica bacterium RIFCSPHIGHO2_02_FULL_51_18]
MKRFLTYFFILTLAMDLAGCATVQRKFTRKKKEPKHIAAAVYLEEGPYQKKYSNDYYYKTHFTLWKSWHDELVNQLGGNSKKVARCAQETYGQLTELNRYLIPETQAELKPYLDSLTKIAKRLEEGTITSSEEGGVRVELEKIKRIVSNNFYYDKVKNKLVPEIVDLGTPHTNSTP